MSFEVDAIRAEIERVDNIKQAFNTVRQEVDNVESLKLRSDIYDALSTLENIVLNRTNEESFMPDAKILLVGDLGVGKTALIRHFLYRDFDPDVDRYVILKIVIVFFLFCISFINLQL